MTIPKDNSLTKLKLAKELRKEMTPHERKLWYLFLRNYPVKIYKQRIIENYIVDFYCHQARLVIELDGSQHYMPGGILYDEERSKLLKKHNLLVLRFSNKDVNENFEGVCCIIEKTINERLDPLTR